MLVSESQGNYHRYWHIEFNVQIVKDWGLWLDNHLFLYPLSILIIFFGGSLGSRMSIIMVSRVSKCLNIEFGLGLLLLLLFCSVSSTASCVHDWDWAEMLSSLKCIVGVTIIIFAPLQYVNVQIFSIHPKNIIAAERIWSINK